MKKTSLIAAFILLLFTSTLVAGCVPGFISDNSGSQVIKEYNFTDFTAIDAGHAFKVEVNRSDNYSVTIIIGEKIVDRLVVTRTGDTLKIDFKEPVLNVRGRPSALITMPDLRRLQLSGAAEGIVKGFKSSNDFALEVSGSSNLDIDMEAGKFKTNVSGASRANGYLKASSSDIEVSGASRITLTGSGGDIGIEVSGASQANLENYAVANADINLSGAGQAKMLINGRLDADLSGASHLEYGGKPTLGRLNVSGGSSLKPR